MSFPALVVAAPLPIDAHEPENLPPSKEAQMSDGDVATAGSPSRASYRRSTTIEASIGVGLLVSSHADGGIGLSGVNLGIGGFLNSRLAIAARFAGVLTRGDNPVTLLFLGGVVQYWIDDKLWVGGGLGLGNVDGDRGSANGLGFDVRGGYTIKQTREHAVGVSVEVLPALFAGRVLTGIAVLAGYQYL